MVTAAGQLVLIRIFTNTNTIMNTNVNINTNTKLVSLSTGLVAILSKRQWLLQLASSARNLHKEVFDLCLWLLPPAGFAEFACTCNSVILGELTTDYQHLY